MLHIVNIQTIKLEITNGAQQQPNKQMVPNIDNFPPNSTILRATMKPTMNTIHIINGNTKSDDSIVLPYAKLVNIEINNVYNNGPNISGSYNYFQSIDQFLNANGTKVCAVLVKTKSKSLLIVCHGVSLIESNKYCGGGGCGGFY